MQYHLEPEFYTLIEVAKTYKVGINKHRLRNYTMDAIEVYAESLNPEEGDREVTIERDVNFNRGAYETLKLSFHSGGDITFFGGRIAMPDGYELTKIPKKIEDGEG